MPEQGTTVALRDPDTGHLHKITKVVAYNTGGFAALTPYHSTCSGFLCKAPVDYKKSQSTFSLENVIAFSANDRVKLSYHPDGFVQFSGEVQGSVISGRDPATGEPKGLGLMTQPLSNPIKSGPTFSLTIWGLSEFEKVRGREKHVLAFEENDWYYRGCRPTEANGWTVEFFVFLDHYWAATRKKNGRFILTLALIGFQASMGVIDMSVIELPNQPIFLGAFANRCKTNFSSTSGWSLSGPGRFDQKTKLGHFLWACYPKPPSSLKMIPLDMSEKGSQVLHLNPITSNQTG